MKKSNTRKYNLDLLKIIAMGMIVNIHILGHGQILSSAKVGSGTYYISWLMYNISLIAVNIYVLISGYFLCDSEFKFKKIVDLFLKTVIYSVGIYIALSLFGKVEFNLKNLVKTAMPITSNQYWFITRYMVMYIFTPFMNTLINNMDKKKHLILCLLLVVFASFICPLFYIMSGSKYALSGTSSIWFMSLYIIAGYIKKYDFQVDIKKLVLSFLAGMLLALSIKYSFDYIYCIYKKGIFELASNLMFSYSSISCIVMTVSLFLIFLKLDINNKLVIKLIKFISPLTLGVYLIHDNIYLKSYIWNKIKPTQFMYNYMFGFNIIANVLIIYNICIFVEYIRIKIFDKLKINTMENKLCETLQCVLNKTNV